MADDRRKRSRLTIVLLSAALFCLVVAIAAFHLLRVLPAKRGRPFASCRNHAAFVALTLDRHVLEHRQPPYVPGLPGEELVCRIGYDHSFGLNCHAGAPGQGVGGWQMVNASPKTWDEVLRTMGDKPIPVIWCGKPHQPGEPWEGTVRIVIGFGVAMPAPPSLGELLGRYVSTDSDGVKHLDYFRSSIAYGMPEEELKARLAEVNAILRKNGEPETPLNVEGRRDYWKLAEPFQTDPTQ